MIGNGNIKTKMLDFEECVLIGWLANTVREPANQNVYLKVQRFCFILRLSIISDPIIGVVILTKLSRSRKPMTLHVCLVPVL